MILHVPNYLGPFQHIAKHKLRQTFSKLQTNGCAWSRTLLLHCQQRGNMACPVIRQHKAAASAAAITPLSSYTMVYWGRVPVDMLPKQPTKLGAPDILQ